MPTVAWPAGTKWIGVDLDGTLAAHEEPWRGPEHFGPPISNMIDRVKRMLAAGRRVKIFTARVAGGDGRPIGEIYDAIEAWCQEHIGQILEITCVKDYDCEMFYDDRAVQIERDTGERMDGAWDPWDGPEPEDHVLGPDEIDVTQTEEGDLADLKGQMDAVLQKIDHFVALHGKALDRKGAEG